jgi:hypothetical protein
MHPVISDALRLANEGEPAEAIAKLRTFLTQPLSSRDAAYIKGSIGALVIQAHHRATSRAYNNQDSGLEEAERLMRDARREFPGQLGPELAYCLLELRKLENLSEIDELLAGQDGILARFVSGRLPLMKAFDQCNERHCELVSAPRLHAPRPQHWLARRLWDATTLREPFSHFFLSDVFPAEIYRRLLHVIRNRSDRPSGKIQLTELSGSADELAFWSELSEAFGRADVLDAAIHAIGGERHMQLLNELGVKATVFTRMFWGNGDYALTPHKDSYSGFGQLIFYVPEAPEEVALGTSIYRKTHPAGFDFGIQYRDASGFEKLVTYPFQENSVFGFLNFGDAYHGVEHVPGLDRRTVIHYSIYLQIES